MSRENSIELITVVFAANETHVFNVSGSYFEVIDCPNTVDVVLSDINGAQRGRMMAAEASFNVNQTEFNTIQLTSATAQTVRFAYGTGLVGTRRASGSVSILNKRGTFTQAAATVTTTSANLLAANASRNYLMVQNNDTTGVVYVNLAGAAATAANGVKLLPGASLELTNFVPNGVVTAIGNIASNANVIVVEA